MGVRIIGISGGSGSGKTTIVQRIAEIIPDFICLAQDSYYKSAEFVDNENITAFNFDTDLMVEQLQALKRDITERGRTVESVITQYLDVVRPGHLDFIEPTKTYADLILPEGGNSEKALQVLTSFMQAIR